MSVVLKTTVGDMTFALFTKERPRASLNFLKLCKVKFYNFVLFHKVERNFIAQTGDPTGTGRGGESIFCRLYGEQAKLFEAETKPILKHKKIGTLSMVNDGNGMHGSQFFITLNEDLDYLNGVHTVFGELTDGEDVIKKINDAICDDENRPYKDIRVCHTVVLDDPFDDPKGLEIPDRSPEPTKEMLKSTRIAPDEEIDDTKGKSIEEIEEEIQQKEASARATILEMVGDIPAAEVKPPDNVLFVCKLNPVTTSEDLEIIFSRFGKILSCEVIKDRKTSDSLQYAFIEFENPKDCENAYFKMDNVLIDDRRIHVDFSQSVAKIKWKGKGKGVEYIDEKKSAQRTKEKYEAKPKFALKDKAKPRETKYDLVFEDDERSLGSGEEDTKHKKKTQERSSNGRERHKTKPKRHRSPSSSSSSAAATLSSSDDDDDYHRRKRNKTSHSRGQSRKSSKRERRSRSRSSEHVNRHKSNKKSKREKRHKTSKHSSKHHARSSS